MAKANKSSAHTPAPWYVGKHTKNRLKREIEGGDGIVAWASTNNKPNAHLIAAAPDLLGCVEKIIEAHDDSDILAGTDAEAIFLNDCLAAITKAKGQ